MAKADIRDTAMEFLDIAALFCEMMQIGEQLGCPRVAQRIAKKDAGLDIVPSRIDAMKQR